MAHKNDIVGKSNFPAIEMHAVDDVAGNTNGMKPEETREQRILELIGDLVLLGRLYVRTVPDEKADRFIDHTRMSVTALLRDADSQETHISEVVPAAEIDMRSRSRELCQNPKEDTVAISLTDQAEIGAASGGIRILIAEDDPSNLAMAMAIVDKLGHSADAVVNGIEAVEQMNRARYDMVLMDCQMPVMDGYEATRRIRESNNPSIPVIAVTAHVLPGDLDKCTRSGMNGFLPKPLNPTRLATMIANWCPHSISRQPTIEARQDARKSEAPVFDPEGLLTRLMDDRELAEAILTGFIDTFPSQLQNLQDCFFNDDNQGARLQAHALKGSSATIGANRLSALAQDLEAAAEEAALDHFGRLLPRAVEEFEGLKTAINNAGWLANHSSVVTPLEPAC